MLWRVGILTMLLAWMLLAAPAAAAGIQRHIDSQGVIRISNSASTQPDQSRQNSPSTTTAAIEPGIQPESAPPLAAATQPSPQGPRSEPQAPENLPPAISPGPDRRQDLEPRPETRGIAAAAETGHEAGPLPVKKVAWTGDEAGPGSIPAPQVAVPGKPEVIKEGGIRRYRDQQGVLHITNAGPGREDAGTRLLQADNSGGAEKGFPEERRGQAAAVPAALPLQNVSWSPDNPGVTSLPTMVAVAGNAALSPGNTIRHYRDSRGVIHINNVEPGSLASSHQPQVQAWAGPGDGRAPPPESQPPSLGEAGEQLAQQPGAKSGESVPSPPTALLSAPFGRPETALLGGIRRYRDNRGVWHLESPKDTGLQGAPRLPRLADLGQNLTLASISPATRLPLASGTPAAAIPRGPEMGRSYGGIAVVRDPRGRLTITNALQEVGVGKGLALLEARAQLEPIIQEAARTYGLPATLIRAVIKVESNFTSWAVSPKGAMGLMQLMPGTATFLGVQEPFNPRENIHGGCRYLRQLIDFFGGSVELALAGYNAGYQRVVACGYRVPDIKETQEFLTQVMGSYLAEEKKALLPRI